MQNEVYREGDELSLPVTSKTKSGSPVIVGGLVGVTATAEGDGGNASGYATVWMHGVYNLEVTASADMSVGDKVYIASDYSLSDTNTDTLFGYALSALATGSGTIPVKLAKV